MPKQNVSGLSWGQKTGLVFAGLLLVAVAVVQSATGGRLLAQDPGAYMPPPTGSYTPPADSGSYTPPPTGGTYTPPPTGEVHPAGTTTGDTQPPVGTQPTGFQPGMDPNLLKGSLFDRREPSSVSPEPYKPEHEFDEDEFDRPEGRGPREGRGSYEGRGAYEGEGPRGRYEGRGAYEGRGPEDDTRGVSPEPYDEGEEGMMRGPRDRMGPGGDPSKHLEQAYQHFQKQIERAQKKGLDIGDTDAKLVEFQSLMEQAKGSEDPFAFQNVQDFLDDSGLRDEVMNVEVGTMMTREFEDFEHMMQNMEREGGRLEKKFTREGGEVPSELVEVFGGVNSCFEEAKGLFENGEYEDARYAMEDCRDASQAFWDETRMAHGEFEQARMFERTGDIVAEMEQGLGMGARMVKELASQGKDTSRLENLLAKGYELLDAIKVALEDGDHEAVQKLTNTMEFSIKQAFEREMRTLFGDRGFEKEFAGGAWEDVYKPEDFIGQFEFDDEAVAAMAQKVAAQIQKQVLAELMSKGIPSALLQGIFQSGYEAQAQKTLETASWMSEDGLNELLEKKASILAEIKALEGEVQDLKLARADLKRYKQVTENAANYNFYGNAGEEMQARFADFRELAEAGEASAEDVKALKQDK